MTYWGAPSPGGSKFYLGSSSDTAWNHDILWKARVEKEVAELDPSLDDVPEYDHTAYLAGVNDRTWRPDELEMLKDAVRVHGAGNFSAILGNPQFLPLRSHSEQALKEQWRHMEYKRSESLGATRSAWNKATESQKRSILSRQRKERAAAHKTRHFTSPNDVRASWRGSGSYDPAKKFKYPEGGMRGSGAASPLRQLGASLNKHPELKAVGALTSLRNTLKKEVMVRDQLQRTLNESQNQKSSVHLDLLQERKQRRKAENALRKYQRVLATLASQKGVLDPRPTPTSASPLLGKSASHGGSMRGGNAVSGTRGHKAAGTDFTLKSKAARRAELKSLLRAAERGEAGTTAKANALLGTKASGFF